MVTDRLSAIDPWLEVLVGAGATDLLLVSGSAPRYRLAGEVFPLTGAPVLSATEIENFVRGLLDPVQLKILDEQRDVDFALTWRNQARLRGSAFTQQAQMAVAMRIIPLIVPTFEALALPPVFGQLANLQQGLVLVTGPTGSGKSTTLAALINRINETRPGVILTIEDPIEYVHPHQRSAVLQREIGQDAPSFDRALRAALREDPDVLLVGEMRDAESVGIAMTMAETGHLVLSTLHTNDAAQTVDRIIDVFPLGREEIGRTQLAASLAAVVSQRLVKRIGGGLVAAYEILLATPPVRNLIREGRSNQISNVLRTGQREGMCTLEASLAGLVASGIVNLDDALAASNRPDEVTSILRQGGGTKAT